MLYTILPIIRFIVVHFSLSLFLFTYVYNFVLICVLFYSIYFMSLFCLLYICVFCVFLDPAFGCYTAINVCVCKNNFEIISKQFYLTCNHGLTIPKLHSSFLCLVSLMYRVVRSWFAI